MMERIFLFIFFVNLLSCGVNNSRELYQTTDGNVIYRLGDDEFYKRESNISPVGLALDPKSSFSKKESKFWLKRPVRGESLKVCEDQTADRIKDEMTYGHCSGFLIEKDLLVTAAHCLDIQCVDDKCEYQCGSNIWVFKDITTDQRIFSVSEEDSYKCKKIEYVNDPNEHDDIAIIRLEREVEGAKPLTLSQSLVNDFSNGHVLGYPLGTKLRKSPIYNHSSSDLEHYTYIAANVYRGNSGSPVLNEDNEVIGLLSAGAFDFTLDDLNQDCEVFNVQDESNPQELVRNFNKEYLDELMRP